MRRMALLAMVVGLLSCSGCFLGWNGWYGFEGEQGGGSVTCAGCGSRMHLRRQISGPALSILQPAFKRGYRCTACGCEFTEQGWLFNRR